MKTTLVQADSAPPVKWLAAQIQTRNNRNVMWTRTAVPEILPMLTDHDMGNLAVLPTCRHLSMAAPCRLRGALFCHLALPLPQRAQAQGVEADEAGGVALVVG